MRCHYYFHLLILAIFIFLFNETVFAAAFQFYELGTPIIGTADVGQAVVAEDASTAYFNPAGMTLLPGNAVMLGTQMNLLYTNFSPNSGTTIRGNNGGSAGSLIPGFDAYFVYQVSPKIKLGASITTPYGGVLDYDNHWVGRYYAQQIFFYTINLNPSIAYQLSDWAAIAAGIAIEYANIYQTVALPVAPLVDGQATLKMDNFSPGFNLGILFTPTPKTRVGIAYRSQIIHHFRGSVNFFNIDFTPSAATKMVMPANLIGSISQAVNDQFTILGELGWANWSSMKDSIISIRDVSVFTPANWHDTYRIGLGGRYQISSPLLLQAGVSFDSSPTGSSLRLPTLPMDKQVRGGAGLEYALLKAAKLGLSYEYIHLGTASINNNSTNGTLAGSYSRNYANIFQASVNIDC